MNIKINNQLNSNIKYFEKNLKSFNFYITKDILYSTYGDMLLKMLEFEDYNKNIKINLYCDFTNNQDLINKLENTFKIKFSSINNNPYKLISHTFFNMFNKALTYSSYIDFCKSDIFKGIYSTEPLNNKNSIYNLSTILYEMLGFKKYITIKMNKKYFNLNDINDAYVKIIDFDNKELFDIKKTFLGLYIEYLNNPKDFNKNYKNIKYYAFDNQQEISKNLINNLHIKKYNFKEFIEKIDIDIDFIKKLSNYKYQIGINTVILIKDYNILKEYINKVVNKSEQYQIVFLTSLISLYSDFNSYRMYFKILIDFNIYIKFKNKLKKALNIFYYITENEYNEKIDKNEIHKYVYLPFKINGSNVIFIPNKNKSIIKKDIKSINYFFFYNNFVYSPMEKFFILKNNNIFNSLISSTHL